jgi:hypothetical protein
MQTVVMVVGATILTVFSFQEIASENESGWDSLWAKYNCSIPADFIPAENTATGESCGAPRDDFDSVFRDPKDGDLPWPGTIFGLTVIATWYWCTDQV